MAVRLVFPLDWRRQNKVGAIAEIFKNKEEFRLALAPEGTRKKVLILKTGFYYLALKVNVPIICVPFDYGKKNHNYKRTVLSNGQYRFTY